MSGEIENEILTEARRSIDFQMASVDELRSRTGLLLAAASVSISVLGTTAASNRDGLNVWGFAALGVFVVAVVSSLYVLWPWSWTFALSSKVLAEDWVQTERTEESLPLFLAEKLDIHYSANRKKLNKLLKSFQIAALSVAAEVILLAIQVAG